MKLRSVSIYDYRSIIKAENLLIDDYTVLIGPNNEGKSNILKAIVLSLGVLTTNRIKYLSKYKRKINQRFTIGQNERLDYDWERDYPLNKQTDINGKSIVVLEFLLTEDNSIELSKTVNIFINLLLKVKLYFSREGISIDVLRKGKAKQKLNTKTEEITDFIHSKLYFQYISAIRPVEFAQNIIDSVISFELSELESRKEYQKAIDTITKLQNPILESIAGKVLNTIKLFIPEINSLKIQNPESIRQIIRNSSVSIDDGVETDISLKGDGIISLISIALIKSLNENMDTSQSLIFAIEEPESHLHSSSIHNLKKVLHDISKVNQVIITTHSQILVDKVNINRNILVKDNVGKKPKSIDEIRKSLGIQIDENLSSAYLIVLVEGPDDVEILEHFLSKTSKSISNAIKNGILKFSSIGGASKLSFSISFYKSILCNILTILDNDDEGRRSIKEAKSKNLIEDNEYYLISCNGFHDSEIEDLFDPDIYLPRINKTYGINLEKSNFKAKNKWKKNMQLLFSMHGKTWDEKTEIELKNIVVEEVKKSGVKAIIPGRIIVIEEIIKRIDQFIKDIA
ncbi:MAG: hypothetical protein A2Y33_12620 [Spirochaetes bacterium GWF1_51_8]|nr:MAG: hypothetical protein A2Y33_12620 [Spirochaetes bacterium GWF1_51_8]